MRSTKFAESAEGDLSRCKSCKLGELISRNGRVCTHISLFSVSQCEALLATYTAPKWATMILVFICSNTNQYNITYIIFVAELNEQ